MFGVSLITSRLERCAANAIEGCPAFPQLAEGSALDQARDAAEPAPRPWARSPVLYFLRGSQDDGHRFRVDRPDYRIRLARQEGEEIMRALARRLHRATYAVPFSPYAGEESERPTLVDC